LPSNALNTLLLLLLLLLLSCVCTDMMACLDEDDAAENSGKAKDWSGQPTAEQQKLFKDWHYVSPLTLKVSASMRYQHFAATLQALYRALLLCLLLRQQQCISTHAAEVTRHCCC
jgi:hypothetical protein